MPALTLRKRQGFARIAPHPLSKRIVPPFLVRGLSCVFPDTPMGFFREDRLIGVPKVTRADTVAKRYWDAMPQPSTRSLAAISQDTCQNMRRPTQQDRPQPPFIGPLPHNTPGFIDFQHIVSSRRRQRLKFFFDPGGQRVPRDPKNSTDATHTRPFLIRPQNFLSPVFVILAFWGQDPNRPTVFAEILLAATSIMAVFDNMLTAAFSTLLRYLSDHHAGMISNSCKKEQGNIIIIYNIPLPLANTIYDAYEGKDVIQK